MINTKNRFPWLFVLFSYAMAWILWIPVARTGQDYQTSPLLLFLLLLGAFGPGLAGIFLTYREEGRQGGRDFWKRAFDFSRIRPGWVGMILLFWPGLGLVAIIANAYLGGELPGFDMLRQMVLQPVNFLIVPVLYILQAAVEELGWRGYMLDRVQATWKPLGAALGIGLIHALWHLPMFWIAGTMQITLGFDLDFWIFIGLIVAGSIYSTWCYNSNRRSTLAVILLHASSNLSLALFTDPGLERRICFLAGILGAAVIAASWAVRMWPLPKQMVQEESHQSIGSVK